MTELNITRPHGKVNIEMRKIANLLPFSDIPNPTASSRAHFDDRPSRNKKNEAARISARLTVRVAQRQHTTAAIGYNFLKPRSDRDNERERDGEILFTSPSLNPSVPPSQQ
jgi:hypothetical protein